MTFHGLADQGEQSHAGNSFCALANFVSAATDALKKSYASLKSAPSNFGISAVVVAHHLGAVESIARSSLRFFLERSQSLSS